MNLKVKTESLLKQVEENRAKHIEEYKQAVRIWQESMEEHGQKLREWANAGGDEDKRPPEPAKPYNRVGHYDRYIAKLKWHQGEYIELNEQEFELLVFDRLYSGRSRGMFTASVSSLQQGSPSVMPEDHVEIEL